MSILSRCVLVALLCPAPAFAAGWTLERRTSPSTGDTAVTVTMKTEDMSLTGVTDAPRSAQLVVQCWQSTVSVIVAFPGSLALRARQSVQLGYTIGDQAVAPAPAGVSGNGRATGWWRTPDALPVIEKMKRENALALKVEGDRSAEARFSLTGFAEAVAPVLEACGH